MKYLRLFENQNTNKILMIIDVQKSFHKFFTEIYVKKLMDYCKEFGDVYQVFDNHIDGKSVNKDFLYHDNPKVPVHSDLYHFPNQKDIIEKRYNYKVDVNYFKKILTNDKYKELREKENKRQFKKGDLVKTKEGTAIVFVGNKHRWFHCPKKLYDLFTNLKGQELTIVGGSDSECLEDVMTTGIALGVDVKRDHRFIYSAVSCPIK